MQPSFPTGASSTLGPTVAPATDAVDLRIAPLGDRAIAAIIDIFVMWAPFAVIGMWRRASAG